MTSFLATALFALWSLSFPMGKNILEHISPILFTAIRMTLAGSLLTLFFVSKKNIYNTSKKQWIAIALLGFFSVYLTNIFEFWSLSHLSSTKTCFLYSLSPFLTAFLSYIHFKEKITPKKCLGLLLGIIGVMPAFFVKTGTEVGFSTFIGFTLPEISMLLAVFFSVYGWIILRLLVKKDQVSPPFANGVSMIVGGLMALVTAFFLEKDNLLTFSTNSQVPMTAIHSLIGVTLLSNIICYNFYGYLLKKCTATFLSFFGLLSPLFASLHGYFFYGEAINWTLLIFMPLILLGSWIFYKEEVRKGYIITN